MSTLKDRSKKRKKGGEVKGGPGRRFAAAEKERALTLVASGMSRTDVAQAIGTTTESIRQWVRVAEAAGTVVPAPVTPSNGKSPETLLEAAASGGTEESGGAEPVPPKRDEKSRSMYAPKDPGQGLSRAEQVAILEPVAGGPRT